MKVIMVPVADRPECRLALDHAFHLAPQLEANIVGYHLRPHREERRDAHGERLPLVIEDASLPEETEDQANLGSSEAAALFCSIAEKHGVPLVDRPRAGVHPVACWGEMVGTPDKLFGIIGPTSDLLVVSRPRPRSSGPARAFMLAALLRSGKPLLVVQQKAVKHIGRRVLVAWDQGVQAATALTASLPLLLRAREVHILGCGKEDLPGPKTKHARNYLRHWGIDAKLHRTKGKDVCGEILKTYRENGADLLVMGAYSRSRLRERILGGVTHEMLMKADIPVFALHS